MTSPSSGGTGIGSGVGADPIAAANAIIGSARQALNRHDARGCSAAMAQLPAVVPGGLAAYAALTAALCEMASGQCAAGIQHADAALAQQGTPAGQGQVLSLLYCPIEGDTSTRIKRLLAQVNYQPHVESWCSYYLAAARTAAGEATARDDRTTAGVVLRALGRCMSEFGRCDEARGLWSLATTTDEITTLTLEPTPKCP